jgi:hypothetical protein
MPKKTDSESHAIDEQQSLLAPATMPATSTSDAIKNLVIPSIAPCAGIQKSGLTPK